MGSLALDFYSKGVWIWNHPFFVDRFIISYHLTFLWIECSPSNSSSFWKFTLWTHAIKSNIFTITHSRGYQLVMMFWVYCHPHVYFPSFLFQIRGIRSGVKHHLLLTSWEDMKRNYHILQIFCAIFIENFQEPEWTYLLLTSEQW